MSEQSNPALVSEQEQPVEYRGVPGFPAYRVGSDGSVWSCWRRTGIAGRKGSQTTPNGPWVVVKPVARCKKNGYLFVALHPGCRQIFVHHLILLVFVGPRPEGMECCHFPDRDPTNNALSNLRWDTKRANSADAAVHGTASRGQQHGSAKLTEGDVRRIISEYATGTITMKALGRRYGVDRTNISMIVRRKTWKSLELVVLQADKVP